MTPFRDPSPGLDCVRFRKMVFDPQNASSPGTFSLFSDTSVYYVYEWSGVIPYPPWVLCYQYAKVQEKLPSVKEKFTSLDKISRALLCPKTLISGKKPKTAPSGPKIFEPELSPGDRSTGEFISIPESPPRGVFPAKGR